MRMMTIPGARTTAALSVLTLFATVTFVIVGRDGVSNLVISTNIDAVQLPALALPTKTTCALASVALAGLTLLHLRHVRRGQPLTGWIVGAFGIVFFLAFLVQTAVDRSVPVTGLLVGSLGLSVPLVFGALGGVLSERAGVVNVAIEGQLLSAAFASAVATSVTGSPYIGIVVAMAAGVLVSLLLSFFSIRHLVDQVIVGIVLNVLVSGMTGFLYTKVLANDPGRLNSPIRFPNLPIPVLSEIPIIGPVLFRQTIIVYVMYAAVSYVWYALFRTRWGLRVRAVGEKPRAADTVGIRVNATRVATLAIAGAVVGVGGAYFTLGSVGAFNRDMTAGAGFIALAAVISGRWHPIRATVAALLFGFAWNLQSLLGIIGPSMPSELLLMLPYLAAIVAVAGLVGHVRAPAASGKPYLKGN